MNSTYHPQFKVTPDWRTIFKATVGVWLDVVRGVCLFHRKPCTHDDCIVSISESKPAYQKFVKIYTWDHENILVIADNVFLRGRWVWRRWKYFVAHLSSSVRSNPHLIMWTPHPRPNNKQRWRHQLQTKKTAIIHASPLHHGTEGPKQTHGAIVRTTKWWLRHSLRKVNTATKPSECGEIIHTSARCSRADELQGWWTLELV